MKVILAEKYLNDTDLLSPVSKGNASCETVRLGFTLAEVLITLGIIGVVAAMTMPSLIANYRIQKYENQLKKTYTTVTNGFKMMMAKEECTDIECLGIFNSGGDRDSEFNNKIDEAVRQTFNAIKTCKAGDTSAECQGYKVKHLKSATGQTSNEFPTSRYKFYLPDGAIVSLQNNYNNVNYPNSVRFNKHYSYVTVDINGKELPNTFGIDVHSLGRLYNTGDLISPVALESVKADTGSLNPASSGKYWKNNAQQCGKANVKTRNDPTGHIEGQNCFARIMENNFTMDYLR